MEGATRAPREPLAPPSTARGIATRARLLAAGEEVFGELGFSDASIVEITRRAGVALGTFYLYFRSKQELLVTVIRERGHEMRAAMAEATQGIDGRLARERAGFAAFLAWIGEHPHIYRVVRQADHVDRTVYQEWYRTIADGYVAGLRAAIEEGEIADVPDVEALAYALMGIGDFVGMRWLLWDEREEAPREVLDTLAILVSRMLAPARR